MRFVQIVPHRHISLLESFSLSIIKYNLQLIGLSTLVKLEKASLDTEVLYVQRTDIEEVVGD